MKARETRYIYIIISKKKDSAYNNNINNVNYHLCGIL